MLSIRRILVYLWTLPTTVMSLPFLVAATVSGGHMSIVNGVLEVHGGILRPLLRWCLFLPGGVSAITMGHVVLGRDQETLDWTRSHERVHVRQCERWGPLFVPAYFLAGLLALLRGKRMYMENPFEVEAYEQE
jgi:hypothetical protein